VSLTSQCVLDPLNPARHLTFEGRGLGTRSLEPCEILHADQRRLRTPARRKDYAVSAMRGIVDQCGQPIPGFSQTDALHDPSTYTIDAINARMRNVALDVACCERTSR
jgi:hypothetical protein